MQMPSADDLSERVDELTEALQKIVQWSEAYPLDIFPEPDLKKAHKLLQAGGITLDAISAHCMRHVVEGVGKIAREVLANKGEDRVMSQFECGTASAAVRQNITLIIICGSALTVALLPPEYVWLGALIWAGFAGAILLIAQIKTNGGGGRY